MRKMIFPTILLTLLGASVQASAPVHIALKATAAVVASSDGFFSLGAVAVVTGGTFAERGRLCGVTVGRAPLPNEVRRLTQGDIRLKLRQAGFHPDSMAVIDGADQSQITVSETAETRHAPAVSENPAPGSQQVATGPLIQSGDAITIIIQNANMTISARGVARESGKAGDRIHVHREGVMTDLAATVVDAQTVRMEL